MENENEIEFSNHYDNITEVADFYGLDLQTSKTIEECGELLAELGRMQFDGGRIEALAGEIADVYNMLDELCYLLKMEDMVQDIAEQKMRRARKRTVELAIEWALDDAEWEEKDEK